MSETTLRLCHAPDVATTSPDEMGEKITSREAIRLMNDELEKTVEFLRRDRISVGQVQSEINRFIKILTKTKKKNRGPKLSLQKRFACDEPRDFIPMIQSPSDYRKKLLSKCGCRCAYCDCKVTQKNATIDHVQPKSRGGSNAPGNLVLCCPRCNGLKGSRTVIEWAADILAVHK